jgi:hypothetical protein
MTRKSTLLWLIVSLAYQSAEAGCSFDTECKGDRICENGSCVNPDDYIDDDRSPNSTNSTNPREYSVPQQRIATFCHTPYGPCQMQVAIPVGSSCYCQSYAGPLWGVAQ